MRIFLAGIIQGSLVEAEIHRQDWRAEIQAALARHVADAEVYCHYSLHPTSITYDQSDICATFEQGLAEARASDVLVAYLPSASMGTAIEMHEAARAGVVVLTITPMAANWVVRAYSDRIFKDTNEFESFLADGQLADLLAGRPGPQ
jgi:hypothetical protein